MAYIISSTARPQRLYLMQVAVFSQSNVPVVCYLIQTDDGQNILIDSGMPADFQSPAGMPAVDLGRTVLEQLALLDIKPSAINWLISTHFDMDHAGHHGVFSEARLLVQRQHYELAHGGHQRFALTRAQWDQPLERLELVDGDTELLPGLELIETSGHVPGHQSVLVRLAHAGPVLLTIDAVPGQANFTPDRTSGPMDADTAGVVASTHKLLDLVQREQISQVIFGHDATQWLTLRKLPDYYD